MSQLPAPSPMPAPGGRPAGPVGSALTPVEPLRVLKQYKWPLILTAAVGLVIGVGVFYLLRATAPAFTSTPAQLVLNTGSANPTEEDNRRMDVRAIEQEKLTYAAQILSPDILSAALRGPVRSGGANIRQTRWFQSFNGTPSRDDLQEAVSVSPPPDNLLINIRATTAERSDAPVLANAIVEHFMDRLESRTRASRNNDRQLLVRERNRLEQEITRIENDMAAIMSRERLGAENNRFHEVDAMYEGLIAARLEAERELAETRQYQQSMQQRLQEDEITLTAEDEAIIEQDPKLGNIDQRIISLKEQKRTMLDEYGPGHRAVEQLESQIAAAKIERESEYQRLRALRRDVKRSQLQATASEASGLVASAEGKLQEINSRIEQLEPIRAELQQRRAEYAGLEKQLERTLESRQRYDELIRQLGLEAENQLGMPLDLRAYAQEPEQMSFPPAVFITAPGVAFLLTALVGGLIFLKEMLDTRVKSPACTKLLPQTDLLGVIPDASEDPSGRQEIDMVVARDPSGLLAESFRQVRTEVLKRMDGENFKTLMLAACQSDSGASTITSNLAVSMAYNGRRVLVIDANFRRPVQHRHFDLSPAPGLAEYLHDQLDLKQAIQPTGIENLDLLAIGEADDHILERVESNGFTRAMLELKQQYDLILIDTPPMSIVGDSRQIANRVDASVLVVRAIQEKRGLVGRIVNQLKSAPCELLGVVLNGVQSSAGGYYRRNYQAFYEYQQKNAGGNNRPRALPAGSRAETPVSAGSGDRA